MSQEEAEELGMVDENGQPLDVVSDEDLDKMFLLDPDGNKIALIEGGSRIFSRKNTRVMVRLAKQANRTKSDSDYKKLGKTVFKFLDIQDSNEAEYVDAPTGKSEN
jgi:hypothetical protein